MSPRLLSKPSLCHGLVQATWAGIVGSSVCPLHTQQPSSYDSRNLIKFHRKLAHLHSLRLDFHSSPDKTPSQRADVLSETSRRAVLNLYIHTRHFRCWGFNLKTGFLVLKIAPETGSFLSTPNGLDLTVSLLPSL